VVQKVRDGDVRTVSRLIRDLEDGIPEAKATIRQLYPYTGKAHIIGITGSPGAGKSTIVDAMIEAYRREDKAVGVLAVDPTSPYTGEPSWEIGFGCNVTLKTRRYMCEASPRAEP